MYQQAELEPLVRPAIQKNEQKVSLISTEGMPLRLFLRYVADRAEVSIVADADLDDLPVTIDAQNAPVSQILGAVARRLGVRLTRMGDLYYLGDLRPEDKGVLVRRVPWLTAEQLNESIATLLSQNGRVLTTEQGIVMVGDQVEVLERIHQLLDDLASIEVGSWVVQLHAISISDEARISLGFDVRPAADLAALIRTGGARSFSAGAALNALLEAEQERYGVHVEASPLFVLIEGVQATHASTSEVPVLTTTVADNGVVSEDVDFKQIGLTISATVRELPTGGMLTIDWEDRRIVGESNGYPVSLGESYNTTAQIESGGVYLLGELDYSRDLDGIKNWATLTTDDRYASVQVWARAYRISGTAGAPRSGDGRVDEAGKRPPAP